MTSDEIKRLEATLWQSADTLRANSDLKSTEYATPVLGRICQVRVRDAVEKVLDDTLPQTYDRKLFKDKCNNVYDVIFEYASSGAKWAA